MYGLVIIDDFIRWTCAKFLSHKDETFKVFYKIFKQVQNKKGLYIVAIRSDNGGELENEIFRVFCENYLHKP